MTTIEPMSEEELAKAFDLEEEIQDEPENEPDASPPDSEEQPETETTGPDDEPVDLLEKYATPPEPEPDQVKLKEFETYLHQEYSTILEAKKKIDELNTLKDDKGVGILEMTDEQYNDYLQALQDTGKLEQAAKAQYNRNKAGDLFNDYAQRVGKYKEDYTNYEGFKEQIADNPKWTQVGDEFESSYPGFKEKIGGKVRKFLAPLLTKTAPEFNQEIYNLTRTDDGKRQAVVQALQHLGLLDEVKALVDGDQIRTEKKPSAPDVTSQRKRVQVNTPERDSTASKAKSIASLSQKEFNKLSDDEITDGLIASLNGD